MSYARYRYLVACSRVVHFSIEFKGIELIQNKNKLKYIAINDERGSLDSFLKIYYLELL